MTISQVANQAENNTINSPCCPYLAVRRGAPPVETLVGIHISCRDIDVQIAK